MQLSHIGDLGEESVQRRPSCERPDLELSVEVDTTGNEPIELFCDTLGSLLERFDRRTLRHRDSEERFEIDQIDWLECNESGRNQLSLEPLGIDRNADQTPQLAAQPIQRVIVGTWVLGRFDSKL